MSKPRKASQSKAKAATKAKAMKAKKTPSPAASSVKKPTSQAQKTTPKRISKPTSPATKVGHGAVKASSRVVAKQRVVPSTSVAISPVNAETVELVRELATILNRRSLAELIVDLPDATITLRSRAGVISSHTGIGSTPVAIEAARMAVVEPSPVVSTESAVTETEEGTAATDAAMIIIKSPFVGTFYRASAPEARPFVTVGERVEAGQVLCIVEAMKLMNEIEADVGGVVAQSFVENGQPVEYGQALFKLSRG